MEKCGDKLGILWVSTAERVILNPFNPMQSILCGCLYDHIGVILRCIWYPGNNEAQIEILV